MMHSVSPLSPALKQRIKRLMVVFVGVLAMGGTWLYSRYLSPEGGGSYATPRLESQTSVALVPPRPVVPQAYEAERTSPFSSKNVAKPQRLSSDAQGTPAFVCVLFHVGEDPVLTQRALDTLPKEITIALSPHTPDVAYWAQVFHQKGQEILVNIGLEPEHFPLNDPGPHTLLTGLSPAEMHKRVAWALAQVPHARGVTHESGALFTTHQNAVRTLFQFLQNQHLAFVDTVASPETCCAAVARSENLPLVTVDRGFSIRTLSAHTAAALQREKIPTRPTVLALPLCPMALKVLGEMVKAAEPSAKASPLSAPLVSLSVALPKGA
jgi:polysaccharide deacetylase 2 family uncharacterized protein YibQ